MIRGYDTSALFRDGLSTDAMKIYLETSVVSAIGNDDIPQESEAIGKICKLHDAGGLDLWTSKFTGEEIEKAPVNKRRPYERIYLLLKKVPHVERQKLLGINVYWDLYTSINSPMIQDDPIWSKLRATGLDENDAYHAMLAIKAECDVFLTADYKDFINNKPRKSRIEQEFNIRLMTPTELANELGL